MSTVWSNWSGSFTGTVDGIVQPADLPSLIDAVGAASGKHHFVHAEGSGWAFSVPAYCEGLMVDTSALSGFPDALQGAINGPDEDTAFRIAVEAGITVRNLNNALAGRPRPDGLPGPTALPEPRIYALPSLGGAGGQSIAGVINTGTHGGDAARGPLSDAVLAMVVVGTGGEVRLLQRKTVPPVVAVDRLQANLAAQFHRSIPVTDLTGDTAFDAATVSVGRLGVVWAYVLRVNNETKYAVVEDRAQTTWDVQRTTLISDAQAQAAKDGFFQVVIAGHPDHDGKIQCWTTSHEMVVGDPIDPANDPALPFVVAARSDPLVSAVMQQVCGETLTPALMAVRDMLQAAAGAAIALAGGFGGPAGAVASAWLVARPLMRAAESIDRIGPGHDIGDAVADTLNFLSEAGHPEFVGDLLSALVSREQATTIPNPPGPPLPWKVKGTRFDIADFFDYSHDCYRGDSVEVFLPGTTELAAHVDEILGIFQSMREANVFCGAYISLRFMGPGHALLSPQRWPMTCSIEVAALRGLLGSFELLRRIEDLAVAAGGTVHWGQQNDCTGREVGQMFGPVRDEWLASVHGIEGDSLTFSTPFTISHGLELSDPTATLDAWTDLGVSSLHAAAVVSAFADQPVEVLFRDTSGPVKSVQRPGDRTAGPVLDVRPGNVDAGPSAIRAHDGRIEVFVAAHERMQHVWQQDRPGGDWSDWDVLGSGDYSRVHADTPEASITGHIGGRLELFARARASNGQPLLHAWQQIILGHPLWSDLSPRGPEPITARPCAALRTAFGDQIVCVTRDASGAPVEKHQVGPGDDSGWTGWAQINPADPGAPFALPPGALSGPIIVGPLPGGSALMVLVVDDTGAAWHTLETGAASSLVFGTWQPLPASPDPIDPTDGLCCFVGAASVTVFARTRRSSLYVVDRDAGGSWGPWQSLGGPIVGRLAVGQHADGTLEVVARAAENDHLVSRRQTVPGTW